MKRLPTWLADGPIVSDLAFDVVEHAVEVAERRAIGASDVTMREVVDHLALELHVDEEDVLLALAELQRVGALAKGDEA